MFTKLEQQFLKILGPRSLRLLREKVTSRPVLTIGGDQCTGKSTLAQRVAQARGWKYKSSGMVFRDLAATKGIAVGEMSRLAASDPAIDVEIEYSNCGLVAEADSAGDAPLVLEGRQAATMATYVLSAHEKPPESVARVYLQCSVREQARRLVEREAPAAEAAFRDAVPPEAEFTSMMELARYRQGSVQDFEGREDVARLFAGNADRDESDRGRFVNLYGAELDYRNLSIYDLVIDTDKHGIEETFAIASEFLDGALKRS